MAKKKAAKKKDKPVDEPVAAEVVEEPVTAAIQGDAVIDEPGKNVKDRKVFSCSAIGYPCMKVHALDPSEAKSRYRKYHSIGGNSTATVVVAE